MAQLSRAIGLALLTAIIVGALFEGWLLALLDRYFQDATVYGASLQFLVRTVRNAAYVSLGVVAILHVVADGRLRDFLRPWDLAFAALLVTFVVAAIAGDSSIVLTGHGIFVYVRGAIVLYAVRAFMPSWPVARRVLLAVGLLLVANTVVAVVQVLSASQFDPALGFSGSWPADRAHGLLSHPNQLGHLTGLGLVLLGAAPSKRRLWWAAFLTLGLGLALSQSRESVIAAIAALVVLLILQRHQSRRVLMALVAVVALTGLVWTLQPSGWPALLEKLRGAGAAIETPSGEKPGELCEPTDEGCTPEGIPSRSIRVLYYQQGLQLWLRSPLVGYGVGQFGGSVASEHNPLWYQNPRFGPGGFDMHDFKAKQVDSFWLHLLVETGALGALAYVAWLGMLALPAALRAWRRVPSAYFPGQWPRLALDRYVPAAIVFGAIIAGFSPALEDPVFPALLLGSVGLALVALERKGSGVKPADQVADAAPDKSAVTASAA